MRPTGFIIHSVLFCKKNFRGRQHVFIPAPNAQAAVAVPAPGEYPALGVDGIGARKELDRVLAHCICALAVEGPSFDEVLGALSLYYEGARSYGAYSLLLEEDDSGALVLTAQRKRS